MSALLPVHPRALIRRSVCALLRGSGFAGGVYPSREEPWLVEELPAMGVYAVEERLLESNASPAEDDRELTLAVDLLDREATYPEPEMVCAPDRSWPLRLDDRLDALTLYPEAALTFEAVRDAVTHAARQAGFAERDAKAMIQDFAYGSAAIGFAEDGRRVVACAALSYVVTYRMPPSPVDADKLKTIVTGWDLADFPPPHGGPDGRLEARNINVYPWPEDAPGAEESQGDAHADPEHDAR